MPANARTVVGRGWGGEEKRLLRDPGSDVRLLIGGREKIRAIFLRGIDPKQVSGQIYRAAVFFVSSGIDIGAPQCFASPMNFPNETWTRGPRGFDREQITVCTYAAVGK